MVGVLEMKDKTGRPYVRGGTIDLEVNQPIMLESFTLDTLSDGTIYKRLLSTQISAGKIYLSDTAVYLAGYNPSTKRRVFTATPTTPYDIGDLWLDSSVIKRCTTARASGSYVAADWTAQTLDSLIDGATYSRVLTADISAGHIKLSSVEQSASYRTINDTEKDTWNSKPDDMDEIADGATWKKVLATQIEAGNLKLTSATVKSGEWYDVSGIEIDATHGINIYGVANALTTRATKAGAIQCYVGADGKIYAGAGAVYMDALGLSILGSYLLLKHTDGVQKGALYGSSTETVVAASSAINMRFSLGGGGFAYFNALLDLDYDSSARLKIPVGTNQY